MCTLAVGEKEYPVGEIFPPLSNKEMNYIPNRIHNIQISKGTFKDYENPMKDSSNKAEHKPRRINNYDRSTLQTLTLGGRGVNQNITVMGTHSQIQSIVQALLDEGENMTCHAGLQLASIPNYN